MVRGRACALSDDNVVTTTWGCQGAPTKLVRPDEAAFCGTRRAAAAAVGSPGLSWDRIRAEFQHRDEAGRPDGGVFTPFEEGNESWAELVARVGWTLTGLAVRHAGGTVIAAMHKESVEASLIAFGALPLHRGFDVEIGRASITEWVTDDDPATPWSPQNARALPVRWRLSRLNDCAHLED